LSQRPGDAALGRRSQVLFAALGAGVLAGAVAVPLLAGSPSHPGAAYYTASFARAGQGLDAGRSDVKVRGVTVGSVDSVRLARDGRVTVRLRVDDEGVRVPRDASAAIEPASVFGPKDLDLDLGRGAGPYLRDGDVITRTADPADLGDTAAPAYRLAGAIDPGDVTTLVHTFAQGLNGQGPALRRAIGDGARLVDAAHADRAQLAGLLRDVSGLSGTLGDRGEEITGTAADLNGLSGAVSGRPDRVSQLLDQSGRLADHVSGELGSSGGGLGAIIDGAAPAVHAVAAQNQRLPIMAESLTRLFNGLGGAINQPGPAGARLVNTGYLVPLDLCYNLVDVCGNLSPMDPADPPQPKP